MEITSKNLELLEKIKKMSKYIVDLESLLNILEFSNLKDSDEYKKFINQLKIRIKQENELYNSINANHTEIKAMIEHIGNNDNLFNVPDQLSVLINNQESKLIARRIALKLKETSLNLNIEEIKEQGKLAVFNTTTQRITSNSKFGILMLDQQIKKDIINTIFILLNKELTETTDIDSRKFLTKIKYKMASMYKFAEEELVENNFDTNNSLYWLAQNTAYYYHIDNILFAAYQDEIIAGLGILATNYFNDLEDEDFKRPQTLIESEFYKIILRTSLMFKPLSFAEQMKLITEHAIEIKKRNNMNYQGDLIIQECNHKTKEDHKLAQTIIIKIRKKES